MSKQDSKGIDERHSRSCRSREGGRCNCTPTYQAHVWHGAEGKRIRKTFDTLAAARAWRKDAEMEIRAGEIDTDRGPTLNEALDAWMADLESGAERTSGGDEYKPGTIRCYRDSLAKYGIRDAVGHLRVSEVRTAEIQHWVDALVREGRYAPASIDCAVTVLRAFYRRATVRGLSATNPCTGLMKPAVRSRERQVATPAQAAKMIDALEARDRMLLATAFYAGLRRGELIGLRPDDIDLKRGVIHVRRSYDMQAGIVPPKSRAGNRRVPIVAVLRKELEDIAHALAHH